MIEFTVPFELSRLVSSEPTDSLPFNAPSGLSSAAEMWFMLDEQKCWAKPGMRVTRDNIPQADGDIIHRSFTTGFQMHLAVQFWLTENDRACGEDLRVMWDALMRHLWPLIRDDGRIQWTPSGYGADRMLNEVRMLEWPTVSWQDGVASAEFDLYTRFPYAMDATQQTISLDAIINNDGNAEFYPVIKVHGPASDFELLNFTTGLNLSYDAGNPGAAAIAGGHFAEFDFFRNTVYLDGNSTNLKPGINVLGSDFWPIVIGPNVVQLVGDGTAEVLYNTPWVS